MISILEAIVSKTNFVISNYLDIVVALFAIILALVTLMVSFFGWSVEIVRKPLGREKFRVSTGNEVLNSRKPLVPGITHESFDVKASKLTGNHCV